LDEETGLYYYGARYYDPRTSVWLSTDPLQEKYPEVSTYAYCVNNPVNAIDPDGRSTWVMNNSDGTYRVIGGDLNDKDLNIYVYSIKDGNLARGESIGESDLISSFYNSDEGGWSTESIINPNDNSGVDFFNSFNNEEPIITNYMTNATGGEKYDFKRAGSTIGGENDNPTYYYRGMPIRTENGKKIYSSARDIGNYTAGYIAGHLQIRWDWARKQFDKLESQQKGYPTVEGYSTQNAQYKGWSDGLKSSYDNPRKTLRWFTKSIPGGMKWLVK
jgi:RHS repeat-associated protein